MKNDKREITLNEKDSFSDMLETEKGVLKAGDEYNREIVYSFTVE